MYPSIKFSSQKGRFSVKPIKTDESPGKKSSPRNFGNFPQICQLIIPQISVLALLHPPYNHLHISFPKAKQDSIHIQAYLDM